MEVVRLSGYDLPEKVAIAEKYLVPKIRNATGLDGDNQTVHLTSDTLNQLIKGYCREVSQ